MLTRIHKDQKGLTLIELIVVVAIIAILAFTITPRVLDALNNSKLNGARSVANELHSALERYYANKGVAGVEEYPIIANTTFDALRAELGDTLGLPTNTQNVMSASPAFSYKAYDADPPAATDYTTTETDTAVTYCILFEAKDRANTQFRITPEGVEEDANNGLSCP